jgi:zinc transporter ZupT
MLAAATLGLLGEALLEVHGPAGSTSGAWLASCWGSSAAWPRRGDGSVHPAPPRARPPRAHRARTMSRAAITTRRARGDLRRTYLIIGALSIHRVPEGVAIGAGFVATATTSSGCCSPRGGAAERVRGDRDGGAAAQGGVSPARGLLIVLLTGLALPLGALVGNLVSSTARAALPFVLALAAGNADLRDLERDHPGVPQPRARDDRLIGRGHRVPDHDAHRRRPALGRRPLGL